VNFFLIFLTNRKNVKIKVEEKIILESEHEKAAIMVFFNVKYYVHCNTVLIVNIFPA
jgi:hypothetical protein